MRITYCNVLFVPRSRKEGEGLLEKEFMSALLTLGSVGKRLFWTTYTDLRRWVRSEKEDESGGVGTKVRFGMWCAEFTRGWERER